MSNFAYLHVHTHFSRGGGPASPVEWCRWAVELGYGALGFTDRSPLAGLPAMQRAARETGLTPLYGIEIDLLLPVAEGRKGATLSQPALLLARKDDGVLNLARIASEVYSGWPGSEKALPWDVVAANAPGLVLVLLGGDEAGVPTPCVATPAKKLSGWASAAGAAFTGAVYVGIPHSGRSGDDVLASQARSAAAALELPIVATPTARYLRPEDAPSYEALKAARRSASWPRDDIVTATSSIAPDRPGHDYLRSAQEAAALYAQWSEAIENVGRIVEMCGLDAERWPFRPETSPNGATSLRELARKKLSERLALDPLPDEIAERLDNELDTIKEQSGAWAALGEVVDLATEGKALLASSPMGAPTGAAIGSILAYALGISPLMPPTGPAQGANRTTQDSACLPGLEVPANRVDAFAAALAGDYGAGRLARAACALSIMPAQAVQAAGRVLGVSGDTLKGLALATLEEGWKAVAQASEPDQGIAQTASLALAIRNAPLTFIPDPGTLLAAPRQTHEAATLSAYGPILAGSLEWVPWSGEDLSALGYPAFTLSPTQPLAALDAGLALARRYPVPGFKADDADMRALPALDDNASAVLRRGELAGIPYLTAVATKTWSSESTLDAAAPMVARSLHPKRPPAPDLKPAAWDEITASTGGALLFKDQLAMLLGSLGVAADKVAAVRRALLSAASEDGEAARTLFEEACSLDEDAARALRNALGNHTKLLVARDAAAAWGRIALWVVALKAAHPAAFLAGALSTAANPHEIGKLAGEAHRLGVKIEQPDINRSEAGPVLQRDGDAWAILWGLNQLPGWHDALTASLLVARPPAGFASLRDLALAAVDAGVSRANLDTLIRAGACDTLGTLGAAVRDRDSMLEVLPSMLEWARATRSGAGQLDLFSAAPIEPPVEEDLQEISISEFHIPHSPRQLYLRRQWEEANIGVAFTEAAEMETLVHALERSGDLRSRLLTTARIGEQHVGSSISLVGILCSIAILQPPEAGEKEPLAVGRLEDTEGSIELVAFPPNYKRHSELWTESNQVIVTARVSCHADGEIYLLSEHIAPFQVGTTEEAMTLTIKTSRQSRSAPSSKPAPSAPMHAVSTPVKAGPQPIAAASAARQPQAGPDKQQAFSSGEQATYSLIISIPPAGDDHEVIDSMIALNSLLGAHPGPDSVIIRVQYSPETGKWTSARLPGGVRYSNALEQSIRRLLGNDALAVIKLAA